MTRLISEATGAHKSMGEFLGQNPVPDGETPLSHIRKNLAHRHDGVKIAHKFLMYQIVPYHLEVIQWLLDENYQLVFMVRNPLDVLKSNLIARQTKVWDNFGDVDPTVFSNLDMSFPSQVDFRWITVQFRALRKTWETVPEDRRYAFLGSPAGISMIGALLNVRLPTTPMSPELYPDWADQAQPDFWKRMNEGFPDDVHELPDLIKNEPSLSRNFFRGH